MMTDIYIYLYLMMTENCDCDKCEMCSQTYKNYSVHTGNVSNIWVSQYLSLVFYNISELIHDSGA